MSVLIEVTEEKAGGWKGVECGGAALGFSEEKAVDDVGQVVLLSVKVDGNTVVHEGATNEIGVVDSAGSLHNGVCDELTHLPNAVGGQVPLGSDLSIVLEKREGNEINNLL